MPDDDPWDGFFYPTLTLMIDSYILAHQIGIFTVFAHMRKFYLTYPLPTRWKDKKKRTRWPHVDS